MYRATIDLDQNVIELILKVLILVKKTLPRSYEGYIHKIDEIYVVKDKVERDIIANLYRVLELINKARYDPECRSVEADVNEALQTYKEIREIARKILEKK